MKHKTVTMSDNEAYPASAGIKCAHCGQCSLGWFGSTPASLDGKCKPTSPTTLPFWKIACYMMWPAVALPVVITLFVHFVVGAPWPWLR